MNCMYIEYNRIPVETHTYLSLSAFVWLDKSSFFLNVDFNTPSSSLFLLSLGIYMGERVCLLSFVVIIVAVVAVVLLSSNLASGDVNPVLLLLSLLFLLFICFSFYSYLFSIGRERLRDWFCERIVCVLVLNMTGRPSKGIHTYRCVSVRWVVEASQFDLYCNALSLCRCFLSFFSLWRSWSTTPFHWTRAILIIFSHDKFRSLSIIEFIWNKISTESVSIFEFFLW